MESSKNMNINSHKCICTGAMTIEVAPNIQLMEEDILVKSILSIMKSSIII